VAKILKVVKQSAHIQWNAHVQGMWNDAAVAFEPIWRTPGRNRYLSLPANMSNVVDDEKKASEMLKYCHGKLVGLDTEKTASPDWPGRRGLTWITIAVVFKVYHVKLVPEYDKLIWDIVGQLIFNSEETLVFGPAK